jgi:protein-S-isoprenylcysteine O-methyltransferase Ste14
MALIFAGLALIFDSLATLLLLPFVVILIDRQVIAREERYLEAKFGDDYRAYKDKVRRWL